MADEVSKLYATLGFKVNQDGLKEAQKKLEELAKQMEALNKLTQKQAATNGIFTKKNLEELKHKNQMERLVFKGEMQEKRFRQKEQEHLWRIEERSQKRHSNNMVREMKRSVGVMVRVARNSVKMLASATKGLWNNVFLPNLSNSFNVRNFMMYTGTNLATLQGIQERFARVGSPMSREDIMGELSSVMENITKIRFGEGKLSGYKLGGIQAFAHKRDVSGVLDVIERASKGVSNQDLVYLLNQMGFTGQQWLPYFRARQRVNSSLPRLDMAGQENLLEANASIQTFALGLQRSGEILTAKFSPVLKSVSDKLIDFLNRWVSNINVKKFGEAIDRLVDDFTRWADSISAEDIENWVRMLLNAIISIVDNLTWFANKLGMLKRAAGGAAKATAALFTGHPKDAVKEIIQSQRDLINRNSSYVQNHITLKQEIYGVENKDIAEKVEEAGSKILSSGVKFGETFVTAGLAGG